MKRSNAVWIFIGASVAIFLLIGAIFWWNAIRLKPLDALSGVYETTILRYDNMRNDSFAVARNGFIYFFSGVPGSDLKQLASARLEPGHHPEDCELVFAPDSRLVMTRIPTIRLGRDFYISKQVVKTLGVGVNENKTRFYRGQEWFLMLQEKSRFFP